MSQSAITITPVSPLNFRSEMISSKEVTWSNLVTIEGFEDSRDEARGIYGKRTKSGFTVRTVKPLRTPVLV